ncbi:uncharacterized protein F5147DRAFT_773466 [Suillus discolor]|uniref:Uncharacterized protein n=1 Tax=Suillus discolor TaxID=1912936 RepID=A0A9P7F770_9AGAM|nr:uncharacterized protein F5147DRAFT_773466 [Suillus discolor]KAG2108672.1 hypothetical protein F5147DRAFT_773466 [Suillus discolor]
MSSAIFDPAMLTASPSPSPEPEEHVQNNGDASLDDATLDTVPPKELQESVANQIERSWAVVLTTMDICVKTSPPPKPELLEEQESWLHDWNTAMADMTSVFERARALQLHLSIGDADSVELNEGKLAAKTLPKAVKAWKEKAEESALTAHPARTEKAKAVEKSPEKGKGKEAKKEKEPSPVVTDMGRLRFGGCMTTSSVTQPAEVCMRCAASGAKCVLEDSNARCNPCIKARKGCSFVAAKNKEHVFVPTKDKVVPPSKSTTPTVATDTGTVPDAGESEVEIVGETTADEDVAGTGKTIMVQCAKRPAAARSGPAPKRPRLDLEAQLEEARIESAQLRLRNAELETEVAKYREMLVDLRQHTHAQESELLHMSNQLYSFARDWGSWENEMDEMLEK